MNKSLSALAALVMSVSLYAYEIEIENDTDAAVFQVQMSFFKNQYPSQMFQLLPQEQKTFNVPEGVPLTQQGITVRKMVDGKAVGKAAVYKPRKEASKIDIEIKVDRSGRIKFEGELL